MSTLPEEDPLAAASSETIAALSAFDTARNALYDNLAVRVAERDDPDDYDEEVMNEVNETSTAFGGFVDAVTAGSEEFDDKLAEIRDVWLHDEQERHAVVKELCACKNPNCFELPSKKDFEEMIEDMQEDPVKGLFSQLKESYQESIEMDVATFMGHIAEKFESEGEDDFSLSRLRSLGGHVMDVSKMAAGVSIGIVIARALGKIPF
jgi:hypothetical protein